MQYQSSVVLFHDELVHSPTEVQDFNSITGLASMVLPTKRPGEWFKIDESLEGVVLELKNNQVKLGIRTLAARPEAPPPIARKSSGGDSDYYYSQGGATMLVVSRAAGQHIEINDTVDLSVDVPN